jgi:hypothetical protein
LDETACHVFADACGAAGDEDNLVLKSHVGKELRGRFYGELRRGLKLVCPTGGSEC